LLWGKKIPVRAPGHWRKPKSDNAIGSTPLGPRKKGTRRVSFARRRGQPMEGEGESSTPLYSEDPCMREKRGASGPRPHIRHIAEKGGRRAITFFGSALNSLQYFQGRKGGGKGRQHYSTSKFITIGRGRDIWLAQQNRRLIL